MRHRYLLTPFALFTFALAFHLLPSVFKKEEKEKSLTFSEVLKQVNSKSDGDNRK